MCCPLHQCGEHVPTAIIGKPTMHSCSSYNMATHLVVTRRPNAGDVLHGGPDRGPGPAWAVVERGRDEAVTRAGGDGRHREALQGAGPALQQVARLGPGRQHVWEEAGPRICQPQEANDGPGGDVSTLQSKRRLRRQRAEAVAHEDDGWAHVAGALRRWRCHLSPFPPLHEKPQTGAQEPGLWDLRWNVVVGHQVNAVGCKAAVSLQTIIAAHPRPKLVHRSNRHTKRSWSSAVASDRKSGAHHCRKTGAAADLETDAAASQRRRDSRPVSEARQRICLKDPR